MSTPTQFPPRPVPPGRRPGSNRRVRRGGWLLWLLVITALVGAAGLIAWKLWDQREFEKREKQVSSLLESAESSLKSDRDQEAEASLRKALDVLPGDARCQEMLERIHRKQEMFREKNASAARKSMAEAERLARTDIGAAIRVFDRIHMDVASPEEIRKSAADRVQSLREGACSLRLPADWPAEAYLFIDDVEQKTVKPEVGGIAPGKHSIRVTRYGFRDPARMVMDFRGLDAVALPSVKWQHLGTKVSLASFPEGAAVWRDGRNTGKVTPCTIEDVDDGPLSFTLRLSGHADTPVKGEVKDRKPLKLSANLLELPHLPVNGGSAGERREINLTPDLRVAFRWCPAGRFRMGGPGENEGPIRDVTLSKGFWLGETEFTQKQWEAVLGEFAEVLFVFEAKGKAKPPLGADFPMVYAGWEKICGDNSRQGGLLGKINAYLSSNKSLWVADLPTEAQWEYAGRAGMKGESRGTAADPGTLAWFASNSGGTLHEVATRAANPWGLHDMFGNVHEWCRDWFQPHYRNLPAVDPAGPALSGWSNSIRGGCFNSPANACRSAWRAGADPFKGQPLIGFRLALHPREAVPAKPAKKSVPPAKPKPKPKPKPAPKPKPKPPKKK